MLSWKGWSGCGGWIRKWLGTSCYGSVSNEVRTSPASPDEDLMELKDIMSQTLETKGVLDQYAHSCAQLCTQPSMSRDAKGIHRNPRAARIHETEEGGYCAASCASISSSTTSITHSQCFARMPPNTSEYEGRETLALSCSLEATWMSRFEKSPLLLRC